MAVDTPASSNMTQIKMVNEGTAQQSLMATTPISSSLEKRFLFWNRSKKPKSGYKCKKKFFNISKITKAKNAACPKILENKQTSAFPSLHTALKFIIPGPYLEWPIRRNGRFWNRCKSQDTFNTLKILVIATATATAAASSTAIAIAVAVAMACNTARSKNKYRIVLTKRCKVVGAAIRNKDGSYTKCKRIDRKRDEDDDEDDDE
ncbi:putative secreted effector protein [Erysiphe neolycopersici]|uniref:Putative secreted effector protein n=1 Tax=Erysiphe neolycopersici TaxID=212602 RepID=A0A420H7U5_9PEZI|nr:putative secreted effector protein [Erysiphe neolycopersici]